MEQLSLLKDDFLSLASHELRNPLSSILGNAQLLQRDLQRQMNVTGESGNGNGTAKSDVDQEVQMLERIIHQVRRMDKLVGEMMDITRMRAELFQLEKKQHINIVELVRRVVEQDTITTLHKLDLHTDAQELRVTCDEIRVEQVLNNLLNNAIKYSPKGTPVEVGIESRPEIEPKEVVVWVRDKGPGINEKEQLNIFDRFYRTHNKKSAKVEGLGLGLYIAHEIIHQHGGHIWLESKPGEGSTFYFSLPLE
jgi:signal transduction histidine kinase